MSGRQHYLTDGALQVCGTSFARVIPYHRAVAFLSFVQEVNNNCCYLTITVSTRARMGMRTSPLRITLRKCFV